MNTLRPLTEWPPERRARVKGVFTDIDDTLTDRGHMEAPVLDALFRLRRAGLLVIPITGRPAGWCDLIARMWPVDAVVGENGAFYFRYDQSERRMVRRFVDPPDSRAGKRRRLEKIAEAVLAGVSVLEKLGAEIVEVQMPDVDKYLPAWPILCSAEAVAAHRDHYPERRDDYGQFFRGWLDQGANVSGADYAEANNMRAECNGLVHMAFQDIDVLACPSTIAPAHPVTREILYGPMDDRRGTSFQRYTVPYDFNGMPTLSVPCGLSSERLPLSLQFVGKPLSEPLLCRVGHAYEGATEWHLMRPPE